MKDHSRKVIHKVERVTKLTQVRFEVPDELYNEYKELVRKMTPAKIMSYNSRLFKKVIQSEIHRLGRKVEQH